MSRRPAPPSGQAPPAAVGDVSLRPLAEAVAERYFAEFPEDLERYGEAARAWELHDTQWSLAWAALPDVDLAAQVDWLAGVLAARGFPLGHLARNLELAADAAAEPLPAAADRLRAAAARVRDRP